MMGRSFTETASTSCSDAMARTVYVLAQDATERAWIEAALD
jgi:hypothetical protein